MKTFGRKSSRAATVWTMAAIALVATPTFASAADNAGPPMSSASNPDWMRSVPDSTNLAQMSIPGTHESMSLYHGVAVSCQEDWGGPEKTLAGQLRSGIRWFDIRARITDGDKLAIHHGRTYQNANFDNTLNSFSDYLRDHPSETIVMRFKKDHDDVKNAKPFQDIFDNYVKQRPGLFWEPSVNRDAGSPTPNLSEVRGKVVLAVMNGQQGGRYDNYGLQQFSGWKDGSSEFVQDEYNIPTSDVSGKVRKVTEFFDRTNSGDQSKMYVNFTTGASAGAYPKAVAARVNPGVMDYLKAHPGQRTGAVMMDYPGGGLISEIISHNPR